MPLANERLDPSLTHPPPVTSTIAIAHALHLKSFTSPPFYTDNIVATVHLDALLTLLFSLQFPWQPANKSIWIFAPCRSKQKLTEQYVHSWQTLLRLICR
jgi:hypothetical protein